MTQLYAFGSDPTYYYSKGIVSVTTDGVNWQKLANPFNDDLGFVRVASSDGGNNWITFSSFGQCSLSSDTTNWENYDLENKQWLVTDVQYNGQFWIVGHERNPDTGDETAFIAHGGGIHAGWVRTWISGGRNSILYGIKFTDIEGVCLAVGAADNLTNPLILISTNGGYYWTEYSLPSNWQGPIYSVEVDTKSRTIWLGGKGQIATGVVGNTDSWVINDNIYDSKPRPVTKIKHTTVDGQNMTVAISGSSVWYTLNGVDWKNVSQPGYLFTNLCAFNSQLHIGATSELYQYTGFYASWDSSNLNLTGYNNGVQAYAFYTIRSIYEIDSLTQNLESSIYSCSLDGSVLVGTSTDNTGQSYSVYWRNGIIKKLPFLTQTGYKFTSTAGCNSDASIIVGQAITYINDIYNTVAVYWKNDQIYSLPLLTSEPNAFAISCNGDGSIIIGNSADINNNQRAVFWQNGQIYQLPDLFTLPPIPFMTYAQPLGCSLDGSIIVGIAINDSYYYNAVYWQNGEINILPSLSIINPQTTAVACNHDGTIIIGTAMDDDGTTAAVYWENGNINRLTAVGVDSYPFNISSDGNVIVGIVVNGSNNDPVYWQNGELFTLPYLSTTHKDTQPLTCNTDGSLIAGVAKNDSGIFRGVYWI